MIVSPEIDAVTFESTWSTRLSPRPLTVTPAAGPVIVSVPLVLLSSSWLPLRKIVCGVSKTVLSKSIVLAPAFEFARSISQASEPWPLSKVLVTVNVDISLRSSSSINIGSVRRRWKCRPSAVLRPPLRCSLTPLRLMVLSLPWL